MYRWGYFLFGNFQQQKLILEAEEENFPAILEEVKKAIRKVEPDCKLIEP